MKKKTRAPVSWITRKPIRRKLKLDIYRIMQAIADEFAERGIELSDYGPDEEADGLSKPKGGYSQPSRINLVHRYEVQLEDPISVFDLEEYFEPFYLHMRRWYRGLTALSVDCVFRGEDTAFTHSFGTVENLQGAFGQVNLKARDWDLREGYKNLIIVGLSVWSTPPKSYVSATYGGFEKVEPLRGKKRSQASKRGWKKRKKGAKR